MTVEALTVQEMKAWLTKWAEDRGAIAEFDGEIGFGRPCVGITDGESYVYLGEHVPAHGLYPHRYHKDEYLAVLIEPDGATEDEAVAELYFWVKSIDQQGLTIGQHEQPFSLSAFLNPGATEPILVRKRITE